MTTQIKIDGVLQLVKVSIYHASYSKYAQVYITHNDVRTEFDVECTGGDHCDGYCFLAEDLMGFLECLC